MSRHRAATITQPLRLRTIAKAMFASVTAGVIIGILHPLGPLAAYILGM